MAILTRGLTIAAALALAGFAPAPQGVRATDAWVRATQPGAPNGAAYVTLTNTGKARDRLVAISTPAAKMAHLHQSLRKDGMASMSAVAALDLPPGKPVVLAPGSYHIMLMGLTGPLNAGDRARITLTFEKAGAQTVVFAVRDAAPAAHQH